MKIDDKRLDLSANFKPDLSDLATEIHADNLAAGWWTDMASGQSTLHTRNRPEMLMLAVSEIAEAAEGIYGREDDKLPHLPMYDVELADFVIRLLDLIGAEVSCGQAAVNFGWFPSDGYRAVSRNDRLMTLVKTISGAMEHYRKGRMTAYAGDLRYSVAQAFAIAEVDQIDLFDIIAQKRAFNRTRADHKPENRAKDGGKKF